MILYGQADISLHSLMSSAYKGTMKFYVWIILFVFYDNLFSET